MGLGFLLVDGIPDCDPLSGCTIGMTSLDSGAGCFTASPTGLNTGHTYNLRVIATDPDGVEGSPIDSYNGSCEAFQSVVFCSR